MCIKQATILIAVLGIHTSLQYAVPDASELRHTECPVFKLKALEPGCRRIYGTDKAGCRIPQDVVCNEATSVCPRLRSGPFRCSKLSMLEIQCTSNNDCRPTHLCCPDGCGGRTCKASVPINNNNQQSISFTSSDEKTRCFKDKDVGFIPIAQVPRNRWFYDQNRDACFEFSYYGNPPMNENNFANEKECLSLCKEN